MTITKKIIPLCAVCLTAMAGCAQAGTADSDEAEIIGAFDKAQKLYLAADGVSSESFAASGGTLYPDSGISLESRIKEYTDVFTQAECKRIFSGKRERDGIEYSVISYGITADGTEVQLTADEILGSDFSGYDSVTLFSEVRGIDLSYAAGYPKIISIGDDTAEMKYTALYKGADSAEGEISAVGGKWVTEGGEEYIPSENDIIREYSYDLVRENGSWKFDDFISFE